MVESPVLVERSDGVARWVLNRPDRRNAIGAKMLDHLLGLFAEVEQDDDVRAVVLAGAGKGFCAGVDLRAARTEDDEAIVHHADRMSCLLRAPGLCSRPVIAAIHGFALGAGLGLAFSCDAIVCEEDARLAFPEVEHGLVPALVAPAFLRKAGYAFAFRHLATGLALPPRRAADLGLLDLAPPGGAPRLADTLARDFASAGPGLLPAMKTLLRKAEQVDEVAAMALAREANIAAKRRRRAQVREV